MVILQTESITQGSSYCRLRCRWGGCMHPSNTLVWKHESATVFNVKKQFERNGNILFAYAGFIIRKPMNAKAWAQLNLSPRGICHTHAHTSAHTHTHTHTHETPQSISLRSYAMNLTHNKSYSYPLISDNIPPLHLDMTEWLTHT